MVTAEEQPPFISRDEFERRFDDVDAELGELRKGQRQLFRRMTGLERRMTKLEERMTVIEHRFNDFKESVNHRFNALDKRLDDFKENMNHRFTMLMWFMILSNAGIFAVLGWIISRLD